MNEQSVRKLYSILGHNGYWSRIGSLDCKTKVYEDKLLYGIDSILEYASKWDGQRNLFIGRNPRNKDGSISGSSCITFDIDPIREKGVTANDEQHDNAINAGRSILEIYPNGYLCSSGNGCLLLFPCSIGRSDLDLYYTKEKVFINQLNDLVQEHFQVKVDTTSYEEAVIKLIGTQSTKGDGRLSRFIRRGTGNNSESLYQTIISIPVKPKTDSSQKFEGDPVRRFKDAQECLAKLNGEFRDNYEKWTQVGMALREFGLAGLSLWKEWSKKGTKYEAGECEKKWETFDEVPSVSIGSLKMWAAQAGSPIQLAPSNADYFAKLFTTNCESGQSIKTGIKTLDNILGALPKGEISTIAARSGFGKTSFSCTVGEYLRMAGRKVLYFSTEMSYEYIMHKFVSISTSIETQKLIQKELRESERARVREYERELLRTPLIICDEFSPTIEQVKDLCEQHKPDVLIFDHATQSGTHWEYIAQFVRRLKELTNSLNIVTLLASQLNEPPRSQGGEVGPSVRGDIRGSQEIIFLSAIFMMMNNLYEVKGNIQPVELEICKNRFGVSGIKLEIHVDKMTGKYSD